MADTYKALSTVTVGAGGASSITFSNIPQTYTDLVIQLSVRNNTSSPDVYVRVNGASTQHFARYLATDTTSGIISTFTDTAIYSLGNRDTFTANTFSNGLIYIPNYISNNNKSVLSDSAIENNASNNNLMLLAGLYSNTSPITSIVLASGANFVQHSTATLYGVFNADVSSAPATPTIGTATAGGGFVDVTFTGVSNAASYTITSSPGSITATGTTSPIKVFVGSNGLTSGTSYTFTARANNPFGSSAQSAASNSVTARNSTIVVADNGTTSRYSTDSGVSWTSQTLPASTGIGLWGQNILFSYGNGRFVYIPAGGSGTSLAYYSSNGFTWTSSALGISNFKPSTILYTPGNGFVAQSYLDGSNRTMKSSDGVTWSTGSGQVTGQVLGSGYVASAGRWYYSAHNDPNGYYTSTWAGTVTNNGSFSGSPFFGSFGVAASDGVTAVHTGNNGATTNLWSTTTGTSVTLGTLPDTVLQGGQVYGAEVGIYLATGTGTKAMTSTNGTSWTNQTKPNVGALLLMYSRDTGFVGVLNGGQTVLTTPDGVTWTTRTNTGVATQNYIIEQVTNYTKTTV